MKINEQFKQQYLIPGNTQDNWIFEECPAEFMQIARESLSHSGEHIKACNVVFTKIEEYVLNQLLPNFSQEFHKRILARDYVTALIMKEVLKGCPNKQYEYDFVCEHLHAFENKDIELIKQHHVKCFMPHHVAEFSKNEQKIELNFFLHDADNKYLQQAINLFVTGREPYSVKMFASGKLKTFYDQMGNLMENPHDFMSRNVNNFIEDELAEQSEKA